MSLDDLTEAVLARRAFDARVLFRALFDDPRPIEALGTPISRTPLELAAAASLVEWLATQREESPPSWAAAVPAVASRTLLVTAVTARKLERLLEETPEPFRRRNFVAPAGFLTAV
jgi:hypothetical protein